MARSAKRVKRTAPEASPMQGGLALVGGMITRNPVLVGGSTAFLVSLFYVSANALWYQPHAHKGAFFATRELSGPASTDASSSEQPETTIHIERAYEMPARPAGDPVIEQVQRILKSLNFYEGAVDGLSGPATTRAVESYQRKMGLAVTGQVDEELLGQLGTLPSEIAIPPAAAARETQPTPQAKPVQEAPAADPSALTRLTENIQRGLRAFGNEDIDVDGIAGARTKAAIREFQSLFGLPETGEPEEAVYLKMKEVGLTS